MPSYYQPAPIPPDLAVIIAALAPDDSMRIERAFQFAAAAHDAHTRDEGTPYIEHPVRVAVILWMELGQRDPDLVAAALAHDILEDCPDIDAPTLGEIIGGPALSLVQDVTKPPAPDGNKAVRDRAYLDRLPSLSLKSRVLKLADRIDNVRSVLLSNEPDKARRYFEVTRSEFLPLAAATDITALRILQDACDALGEHLTATAGTP